MAAQLQMFVHRTEWLSSCWNVCVKGNFQKLPAFPAPSVPNKMHFPEAGLFVGLLKFSSTLKEILQNPKPTTVNQKPLIRLRIQLYHSYFHSPHIHSYTFDSQFSQEGEAGKLTSGCRFYSGIHLPGQDMLSSESSLSNSGLCSV